MVSDLQFTDRAATRLAYAVKLAQQHRHSRALPIHLAISLLELPLNESRGPEDAACTSFFKQVVKRAHGDPEKLSRSLQQLLLKIPARETPIDRVTFSPSLRGVIQQAAELQITQNDSFVAIDHLIKTLAQDEKVNNLLKRAGISDTSSIETAILQIRGAIRMDARDADALEVGKNLEMFTIDLTSEAREGNSSPVIGRRKEIHSLIVSLSKRAKTNPILVGEFGVGKSEVIRGLAQFMVEHPSTDLGTCQLLSLSFKNLAAESQDRAELEERIKAVFEEIESSRDKIILVVDEVSPLLSAVFSGAGADLLKSLLSRGHLRCIVATTPAEYRKLVARDSNFDSRFSKLLIEAPSVAETVAILRGKRQEYEAHHGVIIRDAAIKAAATLAGRYITDTPLPESAFDLIDEAAVDVSLLHQSRAENLKTLREQHEHIKGLSREIRALKAQLDALIKRCDQAERSNDFNALVDIHYYAIPATQEQIKTLKASRAQACVAYYQDMGSIPGKDSVDGAVGLNEICSIVAERTGIPSHKLGALI